MRLQTPCRRGDKIFKLLRFKQMAESPGIFAKRKNDSKVVPGGLKKLQDLTGLFHTPLITAVLGYAILTIVSLRNRICTKEVSE